MEPDKTEEAKEERDRLRSEQLDQMIAEWSEEIRQAKESTSRLHEVLAEYGGPNAVTDLLKSDRCPEELRKRAEEGREELLRELEQDELALTAEKRPAGRSNRPRRRNIDRI